MSDAFKCDFCGEFKAGRPSQKLFVEEYQKGGGSATYVEKYHLCEGCRGDLKNGKTP